ncbi:hypothetical protein CAAN1_16S03686 [[Candida] anglica]|uniref:NADH dehydrogenase [ubiquinone] 1 alpha subcomplex subunit 13 n=1 Tax=[Candida] anglica TaxID=148631 RepID=A0ABP0E9Z1_9ASCO
MAFHTPEPVDVVKYALFGGIVRAVQLSICGKDGNPLRYKPMGYVYSIGLCVALFSGAHHLVKRNEDLLERRLVALQEQRAQRIALFGEQRPELPEFQGIKRGKFFEFMDQYSKKSQ